MIKAVLFDLDGTLLPMDQDIFIKAYFGGLCKKLAPYGFDPEKLIAAVWQGTEAMVKNNGVETNESVFWRKFSEILGDKARQNESDLEDFYKNEFQAVKEVCGFAPMARELIDLLKLRGVRRILATNPIFPAIATRSRVEWAGLSPNDFELITTYENIGYSKPNPEYYLEILRRIELSPEECVMVGNDVCEDMIAEELGMKVFLLTDDLINKRGKDISRYKNGGYVELLAYLDSITKEIS